MAQDSDVARVAAAMNAPGFKYRSFGNEPVRIRPGTAGTLAQPMAEPPAFVEQPAPLPMPEPVPVEMQEPEPLVYDDSLSGMFPYDAFPQPLPEPPPEPPVMVQAEPPPPPAPEPPPAPLFSWPETPANPPPPVAAAAPALLAQYGMPTAQAAPLAAAQAAQATPASGGFRLLESIGHRPDEQGAARATMGQPGGTLGMLRRAAEGNDGSSTTLAGVGLGYPPAGPLPPLSPTGHPAGLLPAAAVTVPLSDVMRLIAAGATPPPSPFDAFRAALGAQPGR